MGTAAAAVGTIPRDLPAVAATTRPDLQEAATILLAGLATPTTRADPAFRDDPTRHRVDIETFNLVEST